MKREDIRSKFKNSGLTYEKIGCNELLKLKELLNYELNTFANSCDYNTFRMKLSKTTIKDGTKYLTGYIGAKKYVYFKVDGVIIPHGDAKPFSHFKKREAISFNRDGFIGVAGWADDKNVQPILRALDKWIDLLSKNK